MQTATRQPVPAVDQGDVLAAGRLYPMRDPFQPMSHATVVQLAQARREFWIAAASGYLEQAEAGCVDALHDVRQALDAAAYYAPGA